MAIDSLNEAQRYMIIKEVLASTIGESIGLPGLTGGSCGTWGLPAVAYLIYLRDLIQGQGVTNLRS